MLTILPWEKLTADSGVGAFKTAAIEGTNGSDIQSPIFPDPDQISDREPMFSNETRRFLYSTLRMLGAAKPDWVNATLQNGWRNYSADNPGDPYYNITQYRKNVNGDVEIRGLVTNSAPATVGTIFTLPPEYRPFKRHGFGACANGPGIARVQIELDGSVSIVNYGSGVDGAFVFLDNIRFSLN